MTADEIHEEILQLRAELHKELGDFKLDMQKQFMELIKTIWLTQLTTIGIILVGVGLLIRFHI